MFNSKYCINSGQVKSTVWFNAFSISSSFVDTFSLDQILRVQRFLSSLPLCMISSFQAQLKPEESKTEWRSFVSLVSNNQRSSSASQKTGKALCKPEMFPYLKTYLVKHWRKRNFSFSFFFFIIVPVIYAARCLSVDFFLCQFSWRDPFETHFAGTNIKLFHLGGRWKRRGENGERGVGKKNEAFFYNSH